MTGRPLVAALSKRIMQAIMDDIDKEDVMALLKNKFVSPLISAVYSQIHPYVLMVSVLMLVNFSFSLVSCLMCLMSYFRRT
jgi:hypothetical protein